ncbi:hypothetical protein GCM10022235_22300 [Kribbella ginsengisoli]|uniref:Uncharacterized protein n=1 Tax=Kribbella ginsengisoli TaxID=363865 RepID=A0ABP6WP78_9ACTN
MLTHLDGRSTDRHDNSHDRISRNRQMNQHKVRRGGDQPADERLTPPSPSGRGGGEQRHRAAQASASEAGAEGLAYRFLCRPEVQECLEFFGLDAHPGELGRGEPAPGQGGDGSAVAVFEVYADWARQAGDDRDQPLAVAEAHGERVDVRTAGGVMPKDRRAVGEQGGGEVEEEGVGGGSLVARDGFQPDVHGGQIGARTLSHRKKVSR